MTPVVTVEQGEIFGIVGPNGAGKTTTVESIEGPRVPDRGRIRVLGLDPRRDAAELRQRVGVRLQDSQLPDRLRAAEALELYSPAVDGGRGTQDRPRGIRGAGPPCRRTTRGSCQRRHHLHVLVPVAHRKQPQ